MQRLHREVHARRDDAAFIRAVGADDVEGCRRAEIDEDEIAAVIGMGGDGVDQTVGADRLGPVGPDGDAEIDIVLADHQRLALEIFAAEALEIEQRLRHHGRDDRAVDVGRLQALDSSMSWASQT